MDFKQEAQQFINKARAQDSLNNQQQHSSNGNETIKGKNKLAWLWENGRELYSTKWIRDWGDYPSEVKANVLSKLSAKDIMAGFGECIKQAQQGEKWPPSPIEFIALCKVAGMDLDGSFMRLVNREKPLDKAEKKTRGEVGFNCKSLPDDKARKLWEKHYRKNYALMKEGKLNVDETHLLTEHVTANEFDTLRDNYQASSPKSAALIDRLNKIRQSK